MCCVLHSLQAQQINKAEYYYDTDPGVGNGTNIVVTAGDSIAKNLSLSVASLSLGTHRLYIRARNTQGKWSIADSRAIYITSLSTSTPQISKAEYYIDTDPGVGNGIAITGITTADSITKSITINPALLSVGMHRLYIRVRNTVGIWSIADSRSFIVTSSNAATVQQINKAEYFIDTDPGVGNGTTITGITTADSITKNLTINMTGLSIGIHRLYVRVRNTSGTWSIADSRGFVVTGSNTTIPQISKAEYYIDTDPGIGNGIAITGITTADSITKNLAVNINTLSVGVHRIYIRVRNTTGVWSIADSRNFTVTSNSFSSTNKRRIKKAEYYFDTDPGVGNGTPIITGAYADSISISNLNISMASLSAGTHKVFVRAMDSTNVWSIAQGKTFNVCAEITYPNFTYANSCSGSVVNFTSTSTGNGTVTATYNWSFGDNGVSVGNNATHIYTAAGTYNVTLIASNGGACADTIVQSIEIGNTPGTNAVTISNGSQPLTFCQGNNVLLSATTILTNVTYQWQNNSVDIIGATGTQYNALTTGAYRCKISNGCGVSYSIVKNVVVNTFPSINVTPPNNATICAGTTGIFTSVVTGATSQNWYLDGQPISGAISSNYLANTSGDYTLFATNVCGTSQSTTFALAVVPNAPAAVSIAASTLVICPGDAISFIATPTYGGNSPTYQWKKNGINISGATAGNYTTTAAANNDIFSVVMTSNETCVTTTNATSNSVQISVTNAVNASVTTVATYTNICVGQSVTFTATPIGGGSIPTYQWKLNGVNIAGATAVTYTTSNLVNNDLVSVIMTSSSGCAVGSPAVSTPIAMAVGLAGAASVGITPSQNNICEGTYVTFTASPTNGGSLATYQWKLNGVNIANATSITYSSSNFTNNDIVSCEMTSSLGCVTGSPATSNTVLMNVNSNIIPILNIASSSTSICSGTVVNFTSTQTNGGSSPTYQWKKNGLSVPGANSASYSTSNISNNDVFGLQMTSNSTCAVGNPLTSNTITISVGQTIAADVTITATSNIICIGQLVTFTANPVGGGTAPTYQWQKNGVAITGITSATFSSSSLINGDQITVTMTSNATCTSGSPATSSPSVIVVSSSVNSALTISTTNTSICAGTQVTFTATPINGGTNPTYQWKKNGINISSAIGANYSTSTISNLDDFTCEMVSSSSCAVGGPAVSNNITMNVTQNVTASVSISTANTNICAGNSINFFATPASGLNNITYQWKLNGAVIPGALGQIFSTSNISDNDLISLTVSSTDNCVIGSPANSNVVSVTVNQPVTTSVQITSSASSICAGAEVSFTAFPVYGGTNPQYSWTVNGVTILGENNASFVSANIQNGDVVAAELVSNATCVSGNPASSNSITMVVTTCANTIGTASIAGSPFCNSFTFLVPFTSGGVYNTGNIYTAQLSNASGSFANPINIGTLASVGQNGQIICTIPASASAGNGYRIRVVSNSPATIGADNGANLSIISSNFNLEFTANNTSPAAPFNVTFTNNTPNISEYNFIWYFGDGTNYAGITPPTHQYPHNGQYSVSLLAIKILTGCTDTLVKSNYINCTNGTNNCTHTVSINPSTPINGCLGGSAVLTCNTTATSPTYQWNINGVTIGGATQTSLLANTSGYYSVTVYNNGGCPVTTNLLPVNFNNTAPQAPTITSTGAVLACAGGAQTLTASSGFANYLWSNGATTQTISVTESGYYFVNANNGINNGCNVNSETITINASNVMAPEICMVTVDTALNNNQGYNVVVWEKPITLDIDSFVVFREGSQAGIFNRIGAIDYNSLSEFVDITSQPKVKANRYKLAARDTCGGITLPSAYHKTMHLQINPGVGYDRNLSWTHEEGFGYFPSYVVYRKIPGLNWELLETIPSTLNTYTDITTPSLESMYQVQVVHPTGGCTSTAKQLQTIRITSHSNGSTNKTFAVSDSITGLTTIVLKNDFYISPNPSNGIFYLNFDVLSEMELEIKLFDAMGQLIERRNKFSTKGANSIPFEMHQSGLYFMTIKGKDEVLMTQKIVIH